MALPFLTKSSRKARYPRNRSSAPNPDFKGDQLTRAETYRAQRPFPNAYELDALMKKNPDNVFELVVGGAPNPNVMMYVEDAKKVDPAAQSIRGFLRRYNGAWLDDDVVQLRFKDGVWFGGIGAVYTVDELFVVGNQASGSIVLSRLE